MVNSQEKVRAGGGPGRSTSFPLEEQEDFKQNGILACVLKKDMVQHNILKVKSNNEPVASIFAVSSPKEACKESSERASGLNTKIILSRKTVFRLTSNL